MPTLDWIGKKAVVNHHREVPYRLIHCDGALSAGDPEAGNLLVQGDNLEALRALLPYYAGQVKCIYIDPPYNTGKEDWRYNDKVDAETIRHWLGRTVGKEADDLTRHDKWLCMMYPRLRLLREFLALNGVIIVSCDDNEQASLHFLLAEIFGRSNYVGTAIWKNATDNNPTRIAVEHEYVIVYARQHSELPRSWAGAENEIKEFMLSAYDDICEAHPTLAARRNAYASFVKEHARAIGDFKRYKQVDERGVYVARRNLENPGKDGYDYDVIHPRTLRPCAKPLWGWRFPEDRMRDLEREGRIIFGKDETKIPELKAYLQDVTFPFRSVFNIDSRKGSNDLEELFGRRNIFKNPKSVEFVAFLLSYVSEPGDLILDSFSGSGTTGHAVMDLNKEGVGGRRFILIEMEPDIAREVTAERLRRVIGGYDKGGDSRKPVAGLGGGFRFCTLGAPLFDEHGDVAEEVNFPDLAAHVFFSETGTPIPARASGFLLGTHDGRAVYLLFDAGSAGLAREAAGNVLTPDRLSRLPLPPAGFEGARVVYAEGCTVSTDRLKAAGVVFKQIPYQVAGV